jgi:hypothetical protein
VIWLYPTTALVALLLVRWAIDHSTTAVAYTVRPARPVTDCLGCGRDVPAGRTWCSFLCRSFDDRHDYPEDCDA